MTKLEVVLAKVVSDHLTMITKPTIKALCTSVRLPSIASINAAIETLEQDAARTKRPLVFCFKAVQDASLEVYEDALPRIILAARNRAELRVISEVIKQVPPVQNQEAILQAWNLRLLQTQVDMSDFCIKQYLGSVAQKAA